MSHGICTHIHQVTAGPCFALHRNKWYKVRPGDFLLINSHLAPKCCVQLALTPQGQTSPVWYPCTGQDTAKLSSSAAAAVSQRRQSSSSCSAGRPRSGIPSFTPQLPKSATATAQEETTSFLFTAKYSNTWHCAQMFCYPGTETDSRLVNSTFHNIRRRTTIHN